MPADNEALPLSPALKRYLGAFDAHLRARTPDELAVTREAMVRRLFAATGFRPRARYGQRNQRPGRARRLAA